MIISWMQIWNTQFIWRVYGTATAFHNRTCITIRIHKSNNKYVIRKIKRSVQNIQPYIQVIHKRMVRFQKLTRNLFLALHHASWYVFSKPCTKLTLHCNHRSGHLKTENTESLFLLRRHLGNWPRGPALSMRSELLVAHEKLGQLPLLTV